MPVSISDPAAPPRDDRSPAPAGNDRARAPMPATWAPPTRPTTTRASAFRTGAHAGVRDMAPVAIALLPFATVLGIAVDRSTVPDLVGIVMAPIVYAGSANLAVLSVLDAGGGVVAAVGTALVINARFAMYGAALAGRFRGQPSWFRLLGPWLIVDQTFALAIAREEADPTWFRGWWLAAGATLGVSFTAIVAVGVALGPVLPSGPVLRFTVPAVFAALLAGRVRDRPALASAVTAAAVTALTGGLGLGHGLGLLTGAFAGAAAGTLSGRTS